MRHIEVAAAVERVHQAQVCFIAAFQAEANQIQRSRSGQFKADVLADPSGKLLRQADMFPYMKLQALNPVMTKYKPQLERAKAPPQRDVPVAVIDHRS